MGGPADELRIVSLNLQAGVDGWGRPYDVVEACRQLDADVLILQEDWAEVGRPSLAEDVGEALGYRVMAHALATGRRTAPHPNPRAGWRPWHAYRSPSHILYLDGDRPLPRRVTRRRGYRTATPGSWGMAVLSRRPLAGTSIIDLGRLPRDRAHRVALVLRMELGGRPFAVVGTHMSHLSKGSPVQYAALRRAAARVLEPGGTVLGGDMNLWGPAVEALLPGWRRTVRGRTWPADHPHSQVDHLLAHEPATVLAGEVLARTASDHRPVSCRVRPG